MILFKALVFYLDPVFVILLMVELSAPSAREQQTVFYGNSVELCEARDLPNTPRLSGTLSVLEERFSLSTFSLVIIASSAWSLFFLSLKSSKFLSEKFPSSVL